MTKYPNERTLMSFDWAVKTMLRDKANAVVLEGFLSALFGEDVTIQEILESEGNQQRHDEKFNRVDLLIRDSKGQHIIVEIQINRQLGYLQRLLYGTSRVIVDHMQLGQPYTKVVKVITVSIMYFPLGEGKDYIYHGKNQFRGLHTGDILKINEKEQIAIESTIQQHDIFPEYYLICLDRYDNKVHKSVDEWIYMLKNSEVKKEFHSKYIQEAGKKLKLLNMTESEYRAYRDYMGELAEVQDEFETAKFEGRMQGLAEGLAEGKAEGLAEGKQQGEKEALLRIAKKLLKTSMNIDQIAENTGLSIEEMSKIKNEQN